MTRWTATFVALVLSVAAQPSRGQTAPAKPRPKVDPVKESIQLNVQTIDKAASLSDEQKKSIAKLLEDQIEAEKVWQRENAQRIRALNVAWSKALAENDRPAIEKLAAERAALYRPLVDMGKKYDISSVMTAQQKVLWFTHQLGYVERMFQRANLTAQQQARLAEMIKEAAAKATCQADMARPIQEIPVRMRELLTDAQKDALAKPHEPQPQTRPASPATRSAT